MRAERGRRPEIRPESRPWFALALAGAWALPLLAAQAGAFEAVNANLPATSARAQALVEQPPALGAQQAVAPGSAPAVPAKETK